ncbi:MAG: CapA family protein [Bacillota bacterium]|nr:CapA family protein [Bacillota bacterium]
MNQEYRTKKVFRIILSCMIGVALTIGAIFGIYRLIPILNEHFFAKVGLFQSEEKDEARKKGTSSFSFVGVGNNIVHGAVYYWQELGQAAYDYDALYSLTSEYTETADISFINAETICAGTEYGLASYPTFNGPVQILDGIANAGFNWMAMCSDHINDLGDEGIDTQINYLSDHYPHITYTGSHLTEEDSRLMNIINVNGIRVGVQSYTYNLGIHSLTDDKAWKINTVDRMKIEDEIEDLKLVSDVQIVSIHWGNEYSADVTDEQEEMARFLNEIGVDVILGTHPHSIETAEIIHGDEGDTLCFYSLGDFMSCQDQENRLIGGMASFTMNYNHDTKEVSWDNVQFIPTITYFDAWFRTIRTTTIHEYTASLAASHCYPGATPEYVREYVQAVMGEPEGIEVVLE